MFQTHSKTLYKVGLLLVAIVLLLVTLFSTSANQSLAAPWTPTPQPASGAWTPTPNAQVDDSAEPTAAPESTTPNQPTATPSAPSAPASSWQPAAVAYRIRDAQPFTNIEIGHEVLVNNVKDFGINIGKHDQYGASQILKNLIPNPGFESAEFSLMFLARWGATGNRVQPDNWNLAWNDTALQIGHPEKFWNGATYEILTGPAKGRTGIVEFFTHENGFPTYYFADEGIAPDPGDVIVLQRQRWGYFQKRANPYNEPDTTTTRPGSPGTQSLKLLPSNNTYAASFIESFDSLDRDGDSSAGKLLLVNGAWQIEFWAKAARPNDQVRVQLRRINERTFFDQTIRLTGGWRKYSVRFDVGPSADRPNESPSPVVLEMRLPEGNGAVWLDDLMLQRANQSNPTVFSDNFVNRLLELNPGIVRDWGDQLGSSLDNQLAPSFARKTTGASPLSQATVDFHYSLPEFLQLAQHIKAEPWYVIPPTFTQDELRNLIAYLSAPAGAHPYADLRASHGRTAPWTTAFPTIHLEFGNELWGANTGGDQFIGSTVRGGERLGEIAHDRLIVMRASRFFDAAKFDMIIGGQVAFPGRQAEVESRSFSHDTIAFAPYYGQKVDAYTTDAQLYYPLFAEAKQNATRGNLANSSRIVNNFAQGTQAAIYEVNLHTTFGNMPIDIRNEMVTGMGNGLALPLHMLTYQRDLSIRNQVAFTSLQYSNKLQGKDEFVRLWGLLHDVEAGGRKRPGWLGLELANQAIKGDAIATTQSGKDPYYVQRNFNGIVAPIEVPFIQSFAFRQGNNYSLVLFNLNLNISENVRLVMPAGMQRQPFAANIRQLSAPSIRSNNEDNVQVSSRDLSPSAVWEGFELFLPAHSMTVIEFKR